LLLALASAFILGSESRGTRDHILLSQIRGFPFYLLLRLAGLRWRYSTPPPCGKDSQKQKQKQKLAAGKQPARSHLASVPAGTHGHIFVQCQDLCFVLFFLSLILFIDKGGVGLLYIYIYIYIDCFLLTTPNPT
jgi:hypothetical protein